MVKVVRSASKDSSKKKKKGKKPNPNAISKNFKAQAPSQSPFETIWSRRKFDVLGKKRRGEEQRIGLARSRGIDKRKKTLLKDYEESGKGSLFLDERIGEKNGELDEFDKAIMRSQRQMQIKLSKKSKYNLSDGEEDELEINEFDFSGRDDFEDEVPVDDEVDGEPSEAQKRSAILKQLTMNSIPGAQETELEGDQTRQKSKKEVMEEIISKSKHFKAQKAKDKEENDKLIEQLDQQYMSLLQSEEMVPLTLPNTKNGLDSTVSKSSADIVTQKNEASTARENFPLEQRKPDDYEKLYNEMILDMRARPSDRTKTPEEIAQEEKERLEQLEEERRKRMLGTSNSSDDDDDASEDDKKVFKGARHSSGDDLGDSFGHEEQNKLGWINEMLKRGKEVGAEDECRESDGGGDDDGAEVDSDADEEDDEESDDDDIKIGKSLSLQDWEQSDDDNADPDLEGEEEEEEEEEDEEEHNEGDDFEEDAELPCAKKVLKTNKRHQDRVSAGKTEAKSSILSDQQEDLPYTIEAPQSFEELCSLLDNRSDDQIVEAIRRIRAFNAIKIAAENRKKMQVFYGILLQYFSVSANKKPLNFKLVNLLVKPLMEMSAEIPYFAAICARHRLLKIRSQFIEDVKNSAKSCWPSTKTLFLLRLWSMIFPCSDFRHVVMTPAILLMCEYLMRCSILSGRDIAIGSFLCSMVLSVCKQSRKFCPEALVFLRTLLMSALNKKSEAPHDSQFYHLMELKAPRPLLCIHGSVHEINPLDFITLTDSPEDCPYFSSDNFRASMLAAVLGTLRGFVNIYNEFKPFPQMFLPFSRLLTELVKQECMPEALQDKLRDVVQLIEKKADEHHTLCRPLQMRKQKPLPIKLLNPKFEENFVKGRDYDPDRERAEMRKLRKRIKREEKGAARELRKDNYFLSEVKHRDRMLQEKERMEKYGQAKAFLQEQEHAFKSGQLGKGRKRRR